MRCKSLVIFCFASSLLFFFLFLQGSVVHVSAERVLLPTFGKGKIQVRIYTDYFCGPCGRLEPKMEQLLLNLVKKDKVTVTLIDTPIHAHTMLYARQFLYILKENDEFHHALRTRGVLFEAAKSGITEKERLEEYLRKRKVRFRPFDTKPTYAALNALLAQDRIASTPTCVIYYGDKKGVYKGEREITQALELL